MFLLICTDMVILTEYRTQYIDKYQIPVNADAIISKIIIQFWVINIQDSEDSLQKYKQI